MTCKEAEQFFKFAVQIEKKTGGGFSILDTYKMPRPTCLEYFPSCLEQWFSNLPVPRVLSSNYSNTPGLQTKNLQATVLSHCLTFPQVILMLTVHALIHSAEMAIDI